MNRNLEDKLATEARRLHRICNIKKEVDELEKLAINLKKKYWYMVSHYEKLKTTRCKLHKFDTEEMLSLAGRPDDILIVCKQIQYRITCLNFSIEKCGECYDDTIFLCRSLGTLKSVLQERINYYDTVPTVPFFFYRLHDSCTSLHGSVEKDLFSLYNISPSRDKQIRDIIDTFYDLQNIGTFLSSYMKECSRVHDLDNAIRTIPIYDELTERYSEYLNIEAALYFTAYDLIRVYRTLKMEYYDSDSLTGIFEYVDTLKKNVIKWKL